jgi:cellulose synthase/poly-beta-1,6-N-acetylglucosamine synthase-like glycosyltransferase
MGRNLKVLSNKHLLKNDEIIDILSKQQVLPLFNYDVEQIKIHDYSQINIYIRGGYFLYIDRLNSMVLVIYELNNLRRLIDIHCNTQIQLITKKDFYQLFEQNFGHLNIVKAKYFLQLCTNQILARNINYTKSITVFLIIYFLILLNYPYIFHIINITCYFVQSVFKLIVFIRALISENQYIAIHYHPNSWYNTLPIYTILTPLYRESKKLKSILLNIDNIIYPKSRLDVKIIIEEDDHEMIQEIALYDLPSYIHLVQVPISLPRTKPKALNYAMQYCRGEYLVVYDAEDKPDCDQLLKAVVLFEKLPQQYACLQAKLNFYNAQENLITKFLSLEYCLWFEYILKGLSLSDLPVPLGGTSNHLKFNILYKLGGWDAYNVTEDADLGIRLYSFGYKVYIMDSYTMEESPIDLINWLNQRSRWIKGFIQTFFVFLKQRNKFRNFKLHQVIAVIILIGLSPYGFFCLPFIVLTIKTNTMTIINYLWLANAFFALSYLYGFGLFILINKKRGISNLQIFNICSLILWPLYFILHTIACYQSLFELITSPFKWNKTKHGVSKYD